MKGLYIICKYWTEEAGKLELVTFQTRWHAQICAGFLTSAHKNVDKMDKNVILIA